MKPKEPSLSELFHENTKTRRYNRAEEMRISRISNNPTLQKKLLHCFKRYRGSKTVNLPTELPRSTLSLQELVDQRRSVREFTGAPIKLDEAAKLLHCGSGITGTLTGDDGELLRYLRAYPSAGALYPLEAYLIGFHIQSLEQGLYHYYPKNHQLELLQEGDLRGSLTGPPYQEEVFASAAGVIVLTAVFRRTQFKYGERGYRYILLEAGHIAQNIMLAAVAVGLGAVAICGYVDAEIDQLLGIDGVEESCVYMIALGSPQT